MPGHRTFNQGAIAPADATNFASGKYLGDAGAQQRIDLHLLVRTVGLQLATQQLRKLGVGYQSVAHRQVIAGDPRAAGGTFEFDFAQLRVAMRGDHNAAGAIRDCTQLKAQRRGLCGLTRPAPQLQRELPQRRCRGLLVDAE